MYLRISPNTPHGEPYLADPLNARELAVRASRSIEKELERILRDSTWGHVTDGAGWLRIEKLRIEAQKAGLAESALDAMIEFAVGHGWVDADKAFVRAHIEWDEE